MQASCHGNLTVPNALQDEEDVVRPSSGNPRRTKRVQFTCNMCGATTTKMVNPHAWTKGTVFAQCSGCGVKHKLIGESTLSLVWLLSATAADLWANTNVPVPVSNSVAQQHCASWLYYRKAHE